MNDSSKSTIINIVNGHDDHNNSRILAGVNQLLQAAEFIERQEKLDAFKIKSKSDTTLILESTQTMVNERELSKEPKSIIYKKPIINNYIPEADLEEQYIKQLYWNIPRHGPYICRVAECQKEFKRKDNLKCHLKIHIPNRSRPFECQTCDRGYLRHVDLLRHIETVHLGVRKHFCTICSKAFTRKEGLRIHSERCV